MTPRLAHLFISPGHNFFGRHGMDACAHEAVEVNEVECVSGRGIRGDRFFDFKPDYKGQITFFDMAVFRALLAAFGLPAATCPAAVRRNAFTEGLDLNALIGSEFTVQGVRLLGVAECAPCHWMDAALAPGAEAFLKGRGGLRCKILTSGILRANTDVEVGFRPLACDSPASDSGPALPGGSARSFTGLVLAGGLSSRMGEDKALLLVDGEPLVSRQIRLLHEAGCTRVIISGRPGVAYPGGAEIVHDAPGLSGPVAGILAAMDTLDAPVSHLVMIPVDLPTMNVEVLRNLIAYSSSGYGAVAHSPSGIEPLVASIPREVFPAIRDLVAAGELSPRAIYASAALAARLRSVTFAPAHDDAFTNWNRREDWNPRIPG